MLRKPDDSGAPAPARGACAGALGEGHRLILDTPFCGRCSVSYGLLVYALDTRRWALIRRKHSVEFLMLLRGLHRPTFLPFLLAAVTRDEAAQLQRCFADEAYFRALFDSLAFSPEEYAYARLRLREDAGRMAALLGALQPENELHWTWPKGRLLACEREAPLACAKREFAEEVELPLPPPVLLSSTYISETVKTLAGRLIEARYWVYAIAREVPMSPPSLAHPEVSDRRWVDTATALALLANPALLHKVLPCLDGEP